MKHADYLSQQATREYVLRYSDLITHAVTFQSSLRPYNASNEALMLLRDTVVQSFLNCRCRMNSEMYKNAAKRKPATHRPIIVASIEGLNANQRALTVHVHAGFGNVPEQYRNDLPFITALASQGVGVRVLMELAGHRNISTTQAYIDVNDEMKRRAVELI